MPPDPRPVGQEVIDAVDEELTGFLDADTRSTSSIWSSFDEDIGAPGVIVELLRHFVSGEIGAFHTRLGDQPIEVEPSALFTEYSRIPWRCSSTRPARPRRTARRMAPGPGRATIIGQTTAARRTRRTPRTCPMASPPGRLGRVQLPMARPWKASA